MTTYTAIPDSDIDPESPGTTTLFTRLRDNPLAIQEGDASAPSVAGASLVLLASATASSSAAVDFIDLDGSYLHYIIELSSIVPATDTANLLMRYSTNNGSTFIAGANYRYVTNIDLQDGTSSFFSNQGADSIGLAQQLGNASTESLSGRVDILDPSNSSDYAKILSRLIYENPTNQLTVAHGGGDNASASAINAVRFYFNSGNIASGDFRLYGVKDS